MVKTFKPNLIKMKWRSNLDHKNYGVYLMKHMETYTTEPLVEWVCDLKPNDVSNLTLLFIYFIAMFKSVKLIVHFFKMQVDQIRKLRVKYCAEIILSNTNKEAHRIKMAARRRFIENA